jgi:hypothetical protein
MPISLKISPVRPGGERYLSFLKSSSERIRAHRLDHERLDVHLQHVLVQLAVQRVAAALHQPGHVRDLVHAGAGAGRRVGEQCCRRVLARPVVGPGKARIDHALVDGVEHLEGVDHGAVGQHLELHAAVGHLVHAFGKALHQVEVDAGRRRGGLHLQPERLLRAGGTGRAGGERADGGGRHQLSSIAIHRGSLLCLRE